jgi:hypothetical protein
VNVLEFPPPNFLANGLGLLPGGRRELVDCQQSLPNNVWHGPMMPLDFFPVERYDDCNAVNHNMVTTKRKFTQSGHPKTRTEAETRGKAIAATDAVMASAFLNLRKGPAVQRVLDIQKQLAEIAAMATALRIEQFPEETEAQHRRLARQQDLGRRIVELNRQLSSYTFVPMLALLNFTSCEIRYIAAPAPKNARGPIVKIGDGQITIAVNESAAATALARLAAREELHTVHACDQCGTWHVAPRSIDRFCSKECRETWHTKSPNYAARRREIQRNYRKNFRLKIAAEDAARRGKKK